MVTRLAMAAPDLAARLESLTEEQVRGEVSVAVRAALTHTGLTDPTIAKALGLDGREPDLSLRTAVEAVATRLDEEAWSIHEREGDTAQYLAVFGRARAASAAYFSLDPDVRGSADDALYEAQAALGSIVSLRAHLSL